MAYDGLVTKAVTKELNEKLILGKIEKIYQPTIDSLVFLVHTKTGNIKFLSSINPSHARLHLIEKAPSNPPEPYSFCMLLRKHLQNAKIVEISQVGSERIIEIKFETLNELGFYVNKKMVFEIMGKYSNISLVDCDTEKIIDSIKRVTLSESRVRQILPGLKYQYPPKQDKISFNEISEEEFNNIQKNSKSYLNSISGLSPNFCDELENSNNPYSLLQDTIKNIDNLSYKSFVYTACDKLIDYYVTKLTELETNSDVKEFDNISKALEYYYDNKDSSNEIKQKTFDLIKSLNQKLDKLYLKKKRLNEDLLKANDSDKYRLYGELLTANMYLAKPGLKEVKVINYYDNNEIVVPLDEKISFQKNAQNYFKKYAKAKTAIKEKTIQLEDNENDIIYLESILTFLDNSKSLEEVQSIKEELVEQGYYRYRKVSGYKEKKAKLDPIKFTLSNGMEVLVGRNNKENDYLTFKLASKNDIWLHTKDIPGSHVVIHTNGIDISGVYREEEMNEDAIFEAASIAAYHSKGKTSENVPVDIVPIKYVKKPNGAKPGMVIFTNNRTIYVNPKEGKKG